MPLDINDPEVKAELDAMIAKALPVAIEDATKGLKAKNEELINEKRTWQEKAKSFEGLDIAALKELQNKINTDEEMKLLSEGKTDEVFNKRFQKIKNDYDSKITDLTKEAETAKNDAQSARGLAQKTIIEINLRRAAEVAGVLPGAIDDVIRRGDGTFSVESDGTIIQKDKDGNVVTIGGKNSTPAVWLEKLKESSPHYWPQSAGTGMRGNDGGAQGTNLEAALAKAAAGKDMNEYRRLREEDQKKRGTAKLGT